MTTGKWTLVAERFRAEEASSIINSENKLSHKIMGFVKMLWLERLQAFVTSLTNARRFLIILFSPFLGKRSMKERILGYTGIFDWIIILLVLQTYDQNTFEIHVEQSVLFNLSHFNSAFTKTRFANKNKCIQVEVTNYLHRSVWSI